MLIWDAITKHKQKKKSVHLHFYCLAMPPPRMATGWLLKSPAPERLMLGWVGEATGGWPGLMGLA